MIMYDGVIDLTQPNNPRTRIVEAVRPGSRVLEIGCATGFMGEFLVTQKHCSHLAVEIDPEAAERARRRGLRVVEGHIEDEAVLAEVAGRYDYTLFGDVLEHLAHPDRVISRLAGYLDREGHMLASIPNVAHWSVRIGLLLGRFDYTRGGLLDENHLRFFTRRSAAALFERNGLRLHGMEFIYLFPIPIPLAHPVKHWMAARLPGLLTWQFVIDASKP
jgi:2-polyprenyl-3-methyl-5-hydroxy-6-metoxy-1,4-benzoquinol methylase